MPEFAVGVRVPVLSRLSSLAASGPPPPQPTLSLGAHIATMTREFSPKAQPLTGSWAPLPVTPPTL